jgi:GNAT superfamily N-acetyltransferase
MAIAFSSHSPSKTESRPLVRRGGPQDVYFLRSLLVHAYGWHVNVLETEIPVTRYVDGWGRTADTALVWIDRGHRVGAGWYRLFKPQAPGYAFVDAQTPELTIAVVPSKRKHGLGQQLLDALLERARAEGVGALSLSVENGSPAVGFYERNGFAPAGEHGDALTMLLRLDS